MNSDRIPRTDGDVVNLAGPESCVAPVPRALDEQVSRAYGTLATA